MSTLKKTSAYQQRPAYLLFSILLVALSLTLIIPTQGTAASTPLQAIEAIQQSIDTRDPGLFRKTVDLDAIITHGLDSITLALQAAAKDGSLKGDSTIFALILGGLQGNERNTAMAKAILSSELKSFVTTGIRGGYFAGKPDGKTGVGSGLFSSLLHDAGKHPKKIVPGKVLSEKNSEAVVSATFFDGKSTQLPLKLRLKKSDSTWEVVEIINASQLLQQGITDAR